MPVYGDFVTDWYRFGSVSEGTSSSDDQALNNISNLTSADGEANSSMSEGESSESAALVAWGGSSSIPAGATIQRVEIRFDTKAASGAPAYEVFLVSWVDGANSAELSDTMAFPIGDNAWDDAQEYPYHIYRDGTMNGWIDKIASGDSDTGVEVFLRVPAGGFALPQAYYLRNIEVRVEYDLPPSNKGMLLGAF